MIRLGKALNECKSKAEADRVADVIISQVGSASRQAPAVFEIRHASVGVDLFASRRMP